MVGFERASGTRLQLAEAVLTLIRRCVSTLPQLLRAVGRVCARARVGGEMRLRRNARTHSTLRYSAEAARACQARGAARGRKRWRVGCECYCGGHACFCARYVGHADGRGVPRPC